MNTSLTHYDQEFRLPNYQICAHWMLVIMTENIWHCDFKPDFIYKTHVNMIDMTYLRNIKNDHHFISSTYHIYVLTCDITSIRKWYNLAFLIVITFQTVQFTPNVRLCGFRFYFCSTRPTWYGTPTTLPEDLVLTLTHFDLVTLYGDINLG